MKAAARAGARWPRPCRSCRSSPVPTRPRRRRRRRRGIGGTQGDVLHGDRHHVATQIAKSFEAAYPASPVEVERNDGERIAQRLSQERQANISAVDVLDSSDRA
jgi:hypothetical protein